MKRIGNCKVFGRTIPLYELEEKKMKNYFILDGKQIPMSDETAASLRDEQKLHRIGDCFRIGGCGTIVMLTAFDGNLVGATCLRAPHEGSRWTTPSKVDNNKKITKPELRRVLNATNYTPVTVRVEEI